MCLGIPMIIKERDGNNAVAELSGVSREVRLDMVPEAKIGDYVIIHAGFAIQILDEQEANETLELIQELYSHEELEQAT